MNIFALYPDPQRAAEAHLDKHVVKMVTEYAQLLSTAHRVLDGKRVKVITPLGKARVALMLEGEMVGLNDRHKITYTPRRCYNPTHVNHPSGVWTRMSTSNYLWLFDLYKCLADEFEYRYGKKHNAYVRNYEFLKNPPKNIPRGGLTPFAQAMPEIYKQADAIEAYRAFYRGDKARFAKWTRRNPPDWFIVD